jgi:hypothetical protein
MGSRAENHQQLQSCLRPWLAAAANEGLHLNVWEKTKLANANIGCTILDD